MSSSSVTPNPTPPLAIIDSRAETHVGFHRDNNEDAVITDPAHGLVVLGDGIGGHPGGEVASSLAVAETHRSLREFQSHPKSDTGRNAMTRAFQSADMVVRAHGNEHSEVFSLGSTLVAAMLCGHILWVGHAGDSRAYLLGRHGMHRLTNDHSDSRGSLLRSIGQLGAGPDVSHYPVRRGDMVLLCSDGLTNAIDDEEIAMTLRDGRNCAQRARDLVEAALWAGGPDNVTVAVMVFG